MSDVRAIYNAVQSLVPDQIEAALAAIDHEALVALAEPFGIVGGLNLARLACEEKAWRG